MSDHYYRFFPGDYLRDTQGLTLTENGAYRILLDAYYSQEYLLDDIQELYMICRAYQDFEKRAVEKIVNKYFSKNGNGHLINRKAEEEIALRKKYITEQTRKSKLGVEVRKQNKQPTGQPTGLSMGQPGVNPPSPLPLPIIKKRLKPSSSSDDDGLFEAFWRNYPKKVGKEAARKVWKKIKNPKEVIERLKVVLPKQKQSDQWTRDNGQYIPHPATYLNQGRWEDEPDGDPASNGEHDNLFLRTLREEREQKSGRCLDGGTKQIQGCGDNKGRP